MEELMQLDSDSLFVFDAIGTHWEIETYQALTDAVKREISDRIEEFDKTYSRFRSDSLVSKMASSPSGGCFEFPEDSVAIFNLYDKLYDLTEGAVDPLVGRRLEELGYDSNYSLKPASDLAEYNDQRPCWVKDVIRNYRTLVTKKSVSIDIGAAGKGYLVDIVSEILFKNQVCEFLIDAGGDIRHAGIWGMPIGMEHPSIEEHVIGVVDLMNNAICASASNRRAWGNGFHHILDARVGLPTHDVVATWAIAKKALLADGLATALFFTSADKLQEYFEFSSVRMFSDNVIEQSENFVGELFCDYQ